MLATNTACGRIERLPAGVAGRILICRSMVIIRTLTRANFILFIIGVCLAIFAALPHEVGESLSIPSVIVGCFLVFIAMATVMTDWKDRLLRHIASHEVRHRRDRFVDPEDADARFVEVVPKDAWGARGFPESATDVGFLVVDQKNRCLLFEGDQQRYLIPAGALQGCSQEFYSRRMRRRGVEFEVRHYFVAARARISDEAVADFPFRIRMGNGLFDQDTQRRENERLFHDIESAKLNIGVSA